MKRLYIIKAENAGNLTVSLTFSDNTVQTVDIGKFFDKRSGKAERIRRHPHPQYNKYLDPRKFFDKRSGKAERSRFAIENGNIVWGKNWDLIFPVEQLHAGAVV